VPVFSSVRSKIRKLGFKTFNFTTLPRRGDAR
jgi:hypothetical protein